MTPDKTQGHGDADTDAATLDSIWSSAWHPPDRRAPWLWAEEHVTEIPHSPKSGRFSSAETPWIREPLECIADPRVNVVSVVAAIQSGKTMFAEIGTAWKLVNSPSPSMILHQTDPDAQLYWENRLKPFYEKIEPVKALFHPNRFKTKVDSAVYVNGASQLFKGAFNKKNLQGHTLREIWGDETHQWPPGRMSEVEARLSSYNFNALAVFYSQAGEFNDDTHTKFLSTDQREWHYRCLGCGELMEFEWERVERPEKAKNKDGSYNFNAIKEGTVYKCECGHVYKDTDLNRKKMSAKGQFVPMNPNASNGNVGFHWNQLCCKSWGVLMELYLRAKAIARRSDLEELKVFYQKRLAKPWQDNMVDFEIDITPSNYDPNEPWEEAGMIHRRGYIMPRPVAPNADDFEEDDDAFEEAEKKYRDDCRLAKPLIFLTVDVQQTHFWAVARVWSPTGSSRLLEWRGGLNGDKAMILWDDVEQMRKKWGVKTSLTFIDNGFDTTAVNLECAKRGYTALQGRPTPGFNHRITRKNKAGRKQRATVERYYSPVRLINMGKRGVTARVHYWSNLNIKGTLALLRSNQDAAEGATWEVYEGIEKTFLRQLDAEQFVKNEKTGKSKWEQIGKRPNHLLDCEAMQVVAATMTRLVGKDIKQDDGGDSEEPDNT